MEPLEHRHYHGRQRRGLCRECIRAMCAVCVGIAIALGVDLGLGERGEGSLTGAREVTG